MIYDPPKENRKGKLRLDFNENTRGCSGKVIEVLKSIGKEDISMYPEYNQFKKMIQNNLIDKN